MTQNEVSWIVVVVIIALVGLIVTILTPLLKLNSSITKLNVSIDKINKDLDLRSKDMKEMLNTLDAHSKYLMIDKQRLDNHEARLTKLDNQEGLRDVSNRN